VPTNLERRDKLAERHNEKVKVEEEFELLVEHQREEGKNAVLLVSDDIGGKQGSMC
jgi:hypothetical protein